MKVTFVTLMMAMLFCFTSFAETKVTYVSVQFTEGKADPGIVYPVELKCNSNQYEVEDYSLSREYDSWKPGRKVTYTVTIIAKEGYYFIKKDTKVYAQNATVVSDSISRSRIELRINYIPKVTLEAPSGIYFEDEYLAKWDKVAYASAYEARIYQDGRFYRTEKLTDEEIDLSNYATDYEDITFDVRAVPKDSEESKYLRNSEYTNCDEVFSALDNTAYGQFRGGYDNLTFYDSDGYYSQGWEFINGAWYFFDSNNGNRAVRNAWALIDGLWYYFNDYCVMQTGWVYLGGVWYYLQPSGAMATGWICLGPSRGPWYYLDPSSGAMWHDAVTPDGYYVDGSGAWYE